MYTFTGEAVLVVPLYLKCPCASLAHCMAKDLYLPGTIKVTIDRLQCITSTVIRTHRDIPPVNRLC
jgi:hypothetical protein